MVRDRSPPLLNRLTIRVDRPSVPGGSKTASVPSPIVRANAFRASDTTVQLSDGSKAGPAGDLDSAGGTARLPELRPAEGTGPGEPEPVPSAFIRGIRAMGIAY
ncbi:MAG: hypothetical protein HOW97_27020 [Catenulispora sp.]|nr:hypothetical protein [Catenulispora sp.]